MDNTFIDKAKEIKDKIVKADSIGISGHISPDGDCLGSGLSLYYAIKKINPNVNLVKNDDIPDYLHILSGLDKMTQYQDDLQYDLFIIVDCSSLDRTGDSENLFHSAKTTICIDHHASNLYFADINLVDKSSTSTCELVYELITAMDIEYDDRMARNTFIGMLTDTNRFLYSSTDSRTLEIASDLLKYNIDKDYIMQELYQSNSIESLRLSSAIIDKARFLYDNKLSLCTMTSKDLDDANASIEDLEGKINLIRDIDTVEVACAIREEDGFYKVSFRSKNYVDVSEICVEFGGGGHLRAAGFSYHGSLEDLQDKLLKRLEQIDWSQI